MTPIPTILRKAADLIEPEGAAWLIEETWISPLGGGTLYVHRDFRVEKWRAEQERIRDIHRRREPFLTKESTDAMRFASEHDAKTWLAQQPRFIREGGQYVAREHMWPLAADQAEARP